MPTYVYETIDDQGRGTGECFEVVQTMSEPALTTHPETGRPVRRVPQTPVIAGKWSDMKTKGALSNKRLGELGLTRYEKRGDGYYEKTAGQGPNTLNAD